MPDWRTLQSALYQHRLGTGPAGAATWAADVSAEAEFFGCRGGAALVVPYLVGRGFTIPCASVILMDAGVLSEPQAHGLLLAYSYDDPDKAIRIEREINNV